MRRKRLKAGKAAAATKAARAGDVARPKIPQHVILQLWARAAGLCEFEGCGQKLWRHGLTLQAINRSHIAHIVGFSPDGPRGDPERSPLLATDIDNLMLVCQDCHNLIDKKALEDKYPEARLREMKRVHEERIERATSMTPSKKSHALVFTSRMANGTIPNPPTPTQALEAMWPRRYPAQERPLEIDLTTLTEQPQDPDGWQRALAEMNRRFDYLKETVRPEHYSVFALARIPFMIALGRRLGDKVDVDTYQLSKDKRHWKWEESDEASQTPELREPEGPFVESDVVLKVEISGRIPAAQVRRALGEDLPTYSIQMPAPGLGVVTSPEQVAQAGILLHHLFNKIPQAHGDTARVHLFAAVPPPVAVEIGRQYRSHFPRLRVYEYLPDQGWCFTLEV
jgi:hypothetical protein